MPSTTIELYSNAGYAPSDILLRPSPQPVGTSVGLWWGVRATVAAERQVPWTVQRHAAGPVGRAVDTRWRTLTPVPAASELRWAARTLAGRGRELRWGLRAPASREMRARWSVLVAAPPRDLGLRWGVFVPVGSGRELRWGVRARAGAASSLRWAVVAVVGTDLGTPWRVLIPVGSQRDVRWSVFITAPPQTLDVRWRLLAAVAGTHELRWSLVGRAGRDANLRWRTGLPPVRAMLIVVDVVERPVQVSIR